MKQYKNYLITILIVIVLLVVYTVLIKANILNAILFPSLPKIALAFKDSLPTLFESLVSSLKLLIPGVGGATALGIFLGVVIGTNEKLRI